MVLLVRLSKIRPACVAPSAGHQPGFVDTARRDEGGELWTARGAP